MSTCKACGAPIRWARTAAHDRPMPLDPDPDPDGNVLLTADGIAHVLGPLEMLAGGTELEGTRHMPHHATCPEWPARP